VSSLPDFGLDGKVALVTGGSRGLGRSIGAALAAAGADVLIVGRDADSAATAAAEIAAESGRRVVGRSCHVGHWEELEPLVDFAEEEFGKVDILVNNAGMSPWYDRVGEVSEELFDKVVAVNLKGPFRLSALLGERMAAGEGGSIVNVTSLAAIRPNANAAPYAAAKAGLEALTISLAHAFGPSVRVNAVMPGAFMTDISTHWDMEEFERESQRYALRRGGRPEEIAGAVVYLASGAAGYTSGATLRIDGGWP
jgi:NAD(P)-dependent dehydrogenase (short-subunit alcohol dehydrogenase family)